MRFLLPLLLILPLLVPAADAPAQLRPGAEASAAGLWEIAALRLSFLASCVLKS